MWPDEGLALKVENQNEASMTRVPKVTSDNSPEKPLEDSSSKSSHSSPVQSSHQQELDEKLRTLADFFKIRRVELGLSEEQVARALGFTDLESVRTFENGKTRLPVDHLFTLVNLLNVPPDEILTLLYGLALEDDPFKKVPKS